MRHVFILGGLLCLGEWPSLQYQLRRKDDLTPVDFDYRGLAYVKGREVNMLRAGDFGPVTECIRDEEPTQYSVEFAAGYQRADQQKREHYLKNQSEGFIAGWRARWREKKPYKG